MVIPAGSRPPKPLELGKALERESLFLNKTKGSFFTKICKKVVIHATSLINIYSTKEVSTPKRICQLLQKKVDQLKHADPVRNKEQIVKVSHEMLGILKKMESKKVSSTVKLKLHKLETELNMLLSSQLGPEKAKAPFSKWDQSLARLTLLEMLPMTIGRAYGQAGGEKSTLHLSLSAAENRELQTIEAMSDTDRLALSQDALIAQAKRAIELIAKGDNTVKLMTQLKRALGTLSAEEAALASPMTPSKTAEAMTKLSELSGRPLGELFSLLFSNVQKMTVSDPIEMFEVKDNQLTVTLKEPLRLWIKTPKPPGGAILSFEKVLHCQVGKNEVKFTSGLTFALISTTRGFSGFRTGVQPEFKYDEQNGLFTIRVKDSVWRLAKTIRRPLEKAREILSAPEIVGIDQNKEEFLRDKIGKR